MRTLKEIAIELLNKYEQERKSILDEYCPGSIKPYAELRFEIETYRYEIEEASTKDGKS